MLCCLQGSYLIWCANTEVKTLLFYYLVKMFISYTKHLFVSILSRTFVCIFFDFIFSYVPSQQTILFSLYFYLAFLT
nr:MAG TPA: hypothetical protein [Caudoviricetes sp.]